MPIKPENRARYPANWPEVRAAILERAGNKCEHPGCTCRQYEPGYWLPVGWHPCGEPQATWKAARQVAAEDWDSNSLGMAPYPIVIVLTIAHLDHTPENCDPENLRAMCQRHHLAHDAEHHRASAQATRRAKSGTAELF